MDTDYDHDLGFRIEGKAKLKDAATTATAAAPPPPPPPPPQDTCVICLEPVTERAIAVPCNHLTFDFLCLCSWTQENPSCPLCKTPLTDIEYDHRSPDDYKTYHIPEPTTATKPIATSSSTPTRFRNTPSSSSSSSSSSRPRRRAVQREKPYTQDTALAFRRLIYNNQNFSLHVGANRTSQYANFTPSTFSSSPALQSRARIFMRRELQVFPYLSSTHTTSEFLIEYVVALLKKVEFKDSSGEAEKLVEEFLGRDAGLFLHELEAWLRSPYERLGDWDRHVQYKARRRRDGHG